MKKPILIFLASVFLIFLGLSITAMASPYGIEVDDAVKFTAVGPSTGYGTGGEFTIEEQGVADPFIWTSFCVERTEYINTSADFYVGSISDRAIGGGNNSGPESEYDPLSDESAWLFWNYSQGTLGYDSSSAAQIDLQLLLWDLEDEINLDYSSDYTLQMQNWWDAADVAVNVNDWTNNGRVAVVNLYWDQDYTQPAQDQLVAAPIPPAVLLLASGLLGLIGVGRFKFRK